MRLHVDLDIDNDAFLYADGEIQRCLSSVGYMAQETTGKTGKMPIRDVNGNTVGHWWISET